MITDTIFALASGAGRAAIAVIRVSGPNAAAIISRLAPGPFPSPREATWRRLRDPGSGEILDEGLVLWFPGPRSYTGEHSIEFHLHGGTAVIQDMARALTDLGARPAEAGEFTRRAFLHGKLDLTRAEGVADLIDAETSAQKRQALAQLGGALESRAGNWARRCASLLAHQEAAIEFAEDGIPGHLEDAVRGGAAALHAEISRALSDRGAGERLRAGVSVVLLGAPNAGKSSLLNAVAGWDAAIVSPLAGTTRDIVEVRLDLEGVPVTLADTAGLRDSTDMIEVEGVRRALARAEQADLRLVLFACDAEPDAASLALCDAAAVIIASKADLGPSRVSEAIAVSAKTGSGLGALRERITDLAGRATHHEGLLTRPRHRAALTEAAQWLLRAEHAQMPELVAEALRCALHSFGRLTGRVGAEDILDIVFRDFCIGK